MTPHGLEDELQHQRAAPPVTAADVERVGDLRASGQHEAELQLVLSTCPPPCSWLAEGSALAAPLAVDEAPQVTSKASLRAAAGQHGAATGLTEQWQVTGGCMAQGLRKATLAELWS